MPVAQQSQSEVLPMDQEESQRPKRTARARKTEGLQRIQNEPPVPAPAPPTDMEVFARIAADPNVDLAKLEKLIQLKEHLLSANAKAEFDAAFAEMQGDLPEIDERGRIMVEGELRSNYAKNEDIQKFIRPILKRYGFALSFREQKTDDGKMAIVGVLSHKGGHREEDRFITSPDDSGRKNAIQARGSSRSYGQRYTTIFLLNISTREPGFADDDGQSSERPESPDGYEDFVLDLETIAGDGSKGIGKAYKAAKQEYREFAEKHDRARWKAIRAKAKKADAGGAKA